MTSRNDRKPAKVGGQVTRDHWQVRGLFSVALLAMPGGALAQSLSTSLSNFTHGYSASSGEYGAPINPETRDTSGNQVIINGVMQSRANNSIFSQQSPGGVGSSGSGVSQIGINTAIGNNITVITQGNNNTIVVNATQTNTGAISAGTVLNGQINLNNGG
jgi:holdfast attachment protein HfaA